MLRYLTQDFQYVLYPFDHFLRHPIHVRDILDQEQSLSHPGQVAGTPFLGSIIAGPLVSYDCGCTWQTNWCPCVSREYTRQPLSPDLLIGNLETVDNLGIELVPINGLR